MVSVPLFVLLLATYAYSAPVVVKYNISQPNLEISTSKPIIMHLVDDGELTTVPTASQINLTTDRDGLPVTTSRSHLNNQHGPREALESAETSSESVFHPQGTEQSSTLFPTTVQTSSQSGLSPRGLEESWTLFPTTVETSSQSEFHPQGMEQSSTLFPSFVETSTQFNQHGIRGQNVQSTMDLQTTEEPLSSSVSSFAQTTEDPLSSSVSSFAQTTGLFRKQRGEHEEEEESTSMAMDGTTTEFSSTGRLNTVIEIIPGRNSKTEVTSGHNTETEVIPGRNTKTEVISDRNTKTEITPGRNTKTEIISGSNTKTEINTSQN